MNDTIKLSGIAPESITDGPGIRLTLFTQGCPHYCDGCHNPETWSMEGGTDYPVSDILDMLTENPLLAGVTFSGGEPLIRPAELLPLAQAVKKSGKNIVCYTGFLLEDILSRNDSNVMTLLSYVDILVDGPFILGQRDLTGGMTGSSNQRIIDLTQSLKSNKTVLFTPQ